MARAKLKTDELLTLPGDVRRAIEADGEMETVRPSAHGPITREPMKGKRDETLVPVLCLIENAPFAYVAVDAAEVPELPSAAELKAMDKGERKLLEDEHAAALRSAEPVDSPDAPHLIHLRPIPRKKDRVFVPRWCAEMMAAKDQVYILEGNR